jgi:hypothetical protein
MIALGLCFDEAAVPMGFKIRLNDMLSATRADMRGAIDEDQPVRSAPAKSATAKPAAPAKPAAAAPAAAPPVDETPTPDI